jgi:DNA-binding response OmpR family regulator
MPGKIRFGLYELDCDDMESRKGGVLIRLQEQPLRVLAMLAERPGRIITVRNCRPKSGVILSLTLISPLIKR